MEGPLAKTSFDHGRFLVDYGATVHEVRQWFKGFILGVVLPSANQVFFIFE